MAPKDVSSHKSGNLALIFTYKTSFFRNHNMNSIKSWNYKKLYDLRVWGLETIHFDHLIQKDVSSHKSKILASIFTNKNSFFYRMIIQIKKIMKFEKILCPWGLWLMNYIWATWTQRMYLAIILEPCSNFHKQKLIFSRIIRWFQWNYEITKNILTLGSGAFKLNLGPWTQKTYQAISTKPQLQFSQKDLILEISKNSLTYKLCIFGPLGPRRCI